MGIAITIVATVGAIWCAFLLGLICGLGHPLRMPTPDAERVIVDDDLVSELGRSE